MSYYSSDTIDDSCANHSTREALYPTEFLNTISLNGLPDHVLHLKIGVPIMLLRNLDPSRGLCNGTRLIVTQLTTRIIEGEIMTEKAKDLIGVISHVGPYDYAGKTSSKKNRKLKIRNKDEQEQGIVLWGEYGESFDEAFVLQKSTDHKIVVAILVGLTAGTYLGKTEATSSLATQIYFDSDITEIVEYQSSSKEDQHPTTPPSLQPPETTLDNNTVNQIIPSAKRALQFEKELHIDQPSPAIANTIQVATNQLYHSQQVDLSKEKQPSTEFSPGQNSKRHKKVMEASTNGEENQLQQPKIADQQPSGHKEQMDQQPEKNRNHEVQLIHTNYLQAVSKIIASKSTAISITLQGKSSTDDLSKLQPTQAHVVNYMKNKLPHMHIILDGENVKNNEI
ncbi:hypothetical protein OsJ_25307 [Oryza sativa Japonica Group]|uniref:DNA helicase Pif1-like 2B domain-containing protein n=1 Tax=Oryza sativa subsp. japonica TaxID=39947 RepID=A3BMP2_ORYSJ|nr:hypothetical protein OsJ_25307 [Oryza sativa Japonica Group]